MLSRLVITQFIFVRHILKNLKYMLCIMNVNTDDVKSRALSFPPRMKKSVTKGDLTH